MCLDVGCGQEAAGGIPFLYTASQLTLASGERYMAHILLISMCEKLKCWLATCRAVTLLRTMTRIFMDQQETNSEKITIDSDYIHVL